MKVSALMTAVVAMLASRGATAKVAEPTLAELAGESDVVVLAKVDVVEPYDAGSGVMRRSATARVLETWYGDPGPQVRFRTSHLSGCDLSYAEVGETAVLFLGKPRPDGVRPILWWGRGRLVVEEIAGAPHVRLRSGTSKLTAFAAQVRPMLMARPPSAGGIDDGPLDDVDQALEGYAAASAHGAGERALNRGLAFGFAAGCAATSLWVAARRRRAARRQPG